jgi:hypothetical protein
MNARSKKPEDATSSLLDALDDDEFDADFDDGDADGFDDERTEALSSPSAAYGDTSDLIRKGTQPGIALSMVSKRSGLPPVPAGWMEMVRDFDCSAFDRALLWDIPAAPFGWSGEKLMVAFVRESDARQSHRLGKMPIKAHLALETAVQAALFRLVGGPPEMNVPDEFDNDSDDDAGDVFRETESLDISWISDEEATEAEIAPLKMKKFKLGRSGPAAAAPGALNLEETERMAAAPGGMPEDVEGDPEGFGDEALAPTQLSVKKKK